MEWGTETLEFANVYAPARALQRIDYYNALRHKLSPDTIVGGDWNTVTQYTYIILLLELACSFTE